ncbi:LacI family DNA-binding transcriptional regulator [Robiginitomaculum antarcticum]|uniref:LacI family DNA-binding transcriptional regulator n=1 Tax=Robiginitomaculum antarcticum TaxID=437507 RepID=UPI000382B749|nr:LacI family DNA-binding transcriptional regulator [Robiginitomaculum antarcticum]
MSATIKDVAQSAGVSFKTVSRVMNGEEGVRDSTRKKVQDAATTLNFQINTSARNLRRRGSNLIALIISNPSRSYIENIQIGAMEWCSRNGFHLVVEDVSAHPKGLSDLLSRGAMAGVILIPPMSDDPDIQRQLIDKSIPFVRIAPETANDKAPSVRIDDRAAAREMTKKLITLGHSRIGLITGPSEFGVSRNRLAGYRDALVESGLTIEETLICEGAFSYPSGQSCTSDLFDLPAPPTAIFASNDDMAAGAIAETYRRGIAVPADVTIVGYDDVAVASVISPPLSTVRQPLKDMAAQAAALLLARIRDAQSEPQHIILPHSLVMRASHGPCGKT